MKDILLSVIEVVSGTKTACGEQSLHRYGELLTQDCLARDAFLINSFVAGREVTVGLGSETIELAAYLWSDIMQVACKWLVICIAA